MAEKIPIGSDHAGYELKEAVKEYLREWGYEPEDVGTDGTDSVDYPDYASQVAGKVSSGERKRGILICGTGIGMSIAANKFPNVRAALAINEQLARLSREHNDSNLLTLGGRVVTPEMARLVVKRWLETEFEGGRHQRRLDKISASEKNRTERGDDK